MNKVRRLNDQGLDAFIGYCKDNANIFNKGNKLKKKLSKLPFNFDDDNYTEELSKSIKIEDQPWNGTKHKERFAIGKHIYDLNIPDDDLNDLKLWAWFSIFYWDTLVDSAKWLNRIERYVPCRNTNEVKRVNSIYDHGPLLKAANIGYRHDVFAPYLLYKLFGDQGEIFIAKKVNELGDPVEQNISRKWLTTSKDIYIAYLKKNYLDANGNLTLSFSSESFGGGRRLINVINTVNYAYNLRLVPLNDFSDLINNKNNKEFL